jgi:hypothetical protein
MIKLTDILNEDCWKDYKQVGLKKKNGKMVPNCVPESVVKEELSSQDRTLIYKLTTMALKEMPKSQKQKEIIKKLNLVRTKNGMKSLSEDSTITEIGIFPVKNYLKGIIPSKMWNTTTPQKKEQLKATINDLIKTLNHFWKQHNIPFRVKESVVTEAVDKDDLKNAKFRLKKVLKYLDIEYKKTRRGEKYVQINYIPITRPQSQNPEFVNVRYEDETDLQNIGKALKLKLKESVSEVAERDYKDEYKKFQSSTKSKKYRAELNKYNRDKGTYGNGDNKDASHKGGKIVGFESEKKNRGRAEKSRLKKND